MGKDRKLYGVMDTEGDIVAVTNKKETAEHIMRVVVNHECWNKDTEVLHDLGDTVYLKNSQSVRVVCMNFFATKKAFVDGMCYKCFDVKICS